jgi:hypothetical protein
MLVVQVDFYNDEMKDYFSSTRYEKLDENQAILLVDHEQKHGCTHGVLTYEDGSQKTYDCDSQTLYIEQ